MAESSVPDFERLADCIHRIENGTWPDKSGKGEEYGIHSVKYSSVAEARAICIRTCKRQWARKPGFEALAKRYCAVNWKRWKYMVEFYYNAVPKPLTDSVDFGRLMVDSKKGNKP